MVGSVESGVLSRVVSSYKNAKWSHSRSQRATVAASTCPSAISSSRVTRSADSISASRAIVASTDGSGCGWP